MGSLSLNVSAVVQPSFAQGDALAAASWALNNLQVNCVLSPTLVATPAATAFTVLPVAQIPVTFVLASAPATANSPRVFTLPLRSWTAPFEWRLWAVTGGFVLQAALWHAVFQGIPVRQVPLSLLGFRALHSASTPAARLHATAFGFTAALLLAQYVASVVTLRSSGALLPTTAAPPCAGGAVCTLNETVYLNRALAACPSARVVPVASVGAALTALGTAACPAALLTEADVAFSNACAAVSMQQVGGATAAPLALALSLQGDMARAMSVLLAGALSPGGMASSSSLKCPTAIGSNVSSWQPTTLRELCGIFLLQGAALLAAALMHVLHLTRARLLNKKATLPSNDADAKETRPRTFWLSCCDPDEENEEADDAIGNGEIADIELATAASAPSADRRLQQRRSPSPVRTSDALRASVARMTAAAPEPSGGGRWRSNPIATEEDDHRNAVLAQIRSDLLAAEARQPVARSVVPPRPAHALPPRQPPRSAPGSIVGAAPRGRPMMPREYTTQDVDTRL